MTITFGGAVGQQTFFWDEGQKNVSVAAKMFLHGTSYQRYVLHSLIFIIILEVMSMLFTMFDNCRKNLTNSIKSVSADMKLAMIIKNCKVYWSYLIILDNILFSQDQKLV